MAKKHGALDPEQTYLLVRARVRQSLRYVTEVLEAHYSGEVPGWEKPIIDEDKTADYQFRTVVTLDEWKTYICFEADGIDYDSHVKEETVRRQPEPKIPNLYSALTATWSAWAKLQPNKPWGNWASKPDCKNCGHPEIKHTVKGDQCNFGWKWAGKAQERTAESCDCTKYEPKPVPVPVPAPAFPAGTKSAADSAAVFEAADGAVYPSTIYGSVWDETDESQVSDEDWASELEAGADGKLHPQWCTIFDGDICICRDDDEVFSGVYTITQPAVPALVTQPVVQDTEEIAVEGGLVINGKFVIQEPARPNESSREHKARLARNRRARRRARKQRV